MVAALGVASPPVLAQTGRMSDTDKKSAVLPRIVAKLGDSFETVKANSTYDFSHAQFLGPGTIVEGPYALVYNHPQRGFELSYAKYLGLSFNDESKTTATAIGLAPHQGTLSLSEFWAQFKSLVDKFDRAGWQRDSRYRKWQFADKSYAEFEAEFVDAKRPFSIGSRANVAFWRNDRELLRISIVKVYEKDEPYSRAMGATEARFNLIVDIERDLATR